MGGQGIPEVASKCQTDDQEASLFMDGSRILEPGQMIEEEAERLPTSRVFAIGEVSSDSTEVSFNISTGPLREALTNYGPSLCF